MCPGRVVRHQLRIFWHVEARFLPELPGLRFKLVPWLRYFFTVFQRVAFTGGVFWGNWRTNRRWISWKLWVSKYVLTINTCSCTVNCTMMKTTKKFTANVFFYKTHSNELMVLFSFLKSTLLTKGCGIWGMRVVIVNIFAEVWRKLILLCSLSRYLINRRIKIASFKHRSWVSFFLRHTVRFGCIWQCSIRFDAWPLLPQTSGDK